MKPTELAIATLATLALTTPAIAADQATGATPEA